MPSSWSLVTQADLVIKGSKFSEVEYILSSTMKVLILLSRLHIPIQAQRISGGKPKSNKFKLRLFHFLVLYDGILYMDFTVEDQKRIKQNKIGSQSAAPIHVILHHQ